MNQEQVDHVVVALARIVPDESFVGVGLGTPTALVAGVLATKLRGGHVLAGGARTVGAVTAKVVLATGALLGLGAAATWTAGGSASTRASRRTATPC